MQDKKQIVGISAIVATVIGVICQVYHTGVSPWVVRLLMQKP